jgi:VanZ family protein
MGKSTRKQKLIASQSAWAIAAIGFAGIFATIMFLAYNAKLPPILAQNDKLAHFILYGIAAFLGHKALRHRHVSIMGCLLPMFPCLFALFTLGEELAQSLSPNRSLDAMDLVASFIGIAIGYGLAERSKLG